MKTRVFFFVYSIVALVNSNVTAQFKYEYVDLKIKRNNEMPLRYYFRNTTVLDNRVDSVKIYIAEDGNDVPLLLSFKHTATAAIQAYIEGRTGHLEKNNESLLINLQELRVPNKTFIRTLSKKSDRNGWEKIRNYVFFSADVYAGDSTGLYRKLFSINRKQYAYQLVTSTVREILDDLVELTEQVAMNNAGKKGRHTKAFKHYISDTATFRLINDSVRIPLQQINIPALSRWQNSSILKRNVMPPSCMYPLFEDFKADKQFPAALNIAFSEADSLYTIIVSPRNSSINTRQPWAVADSSGFYIRIAGTNYLQLRKDSAGFSFDVPFSMPDMYQLLSKESISAYNPIVAGGISSLFSPLSPLLDGAVGGVSVLATLISKQKKLDKLDAKAYSSRFRECIVDMDSGDILY